MNNKVKDKPNWAGQTKVIAIKNLGKLATLGEVLKSYQEELGKLIEQALLNCLDLKEEYDEIYQSLEVLTKDKLELIEVINKAVLESGESIQGEKLQAVFSKGRTTWDAKSLSGYALAHPEINELKKVGKPSVSIREIKK